GDVQAPVHRLDAPVTAYGFGETFAAEITTANVIACFACFTTIGMLCQTNGVADGFDLRPVFRRLEVVGRLGEVVGPFVDAPMPCVRGFVDAVAQVLEVVVDLLGKKGFDGRLEFGLVVFDGDDEVALAPDDLFNDVFLAAHGIDGDEGAGEMKLVEQLG